MTQLDERPEVAEAPATVVVQVRAAVDGPPDRPRSVTARTLDDWLTFAGSVVGSLCLVWLLYEQVLPFSGKVGFFVSWFVLFVALYAGITATMQPWPIVLDRMVSAVVQGAALIVGAAVLWTVIYTVYRGFPAWRHPNFFTKDMRGVGPLNPLTKGGILHAIVGSLLELGIAVVLSMPLGLATAVFMTEVGGRFGKVVRTVVEAMTALPDLVAGLFIYAFILVALQDVPFIPRGKTGFAAALALSITMLPIIARSAEVVLRIVPGGLREASLALGASQWKTVWTVVLPTAKSGLATALILGMARGIGESAPVLIVSTPSGFLSWNPFHGAMNSLPLFAIQGLRAPDPNSQTRGWGAATVLLVIVVVLFTIVRLLARPRRGNR